MSARDGDAQPVPRPVREEARREARLHGLLRARLRAGAARRSPPSTPRSTAPTSSTRTTTTSASRSAPSGAWWCRWCATATRNRWREIEKEIADFGRRARDGALKIEEMQGGTFTITNGGVYGSLMSTPILNAPQSGILGMHKIQERPMAVDGQVVIAADDVSRALLRPPHRRRPRGGDLPGAGEGGAGGSGAAGAGFVTVADPYLMLRMPRSDGPAVEILVLALRDPVPPAFTQRCFSIRS